MSGLGIRAGMMRSAAAGGGDASAYITTWNITASDVSNSTPIGFIGSNNAANDITVDWGDGSPLESISADLTGTNAQHIYSAAGIFTVKVWGTFQYLKSSTSSIFSVDQWGENEWVSGGFGAAFRHSDNCLVDTSDVAPILGDWSVAFERCAVNVESFDWSQSTRGIYALRNGDVFGDLSSIDLSNWMNMSGAGGAQFANYVTKDNDNYSDALIYWQTLLGGTGNWTNVDLNCTGFNYRADAASARADLISRGLNITDSGPI